MASALARAVRACCHSGTPAAVAVNTAPATTSTSRPAPCTWPEETETSHAETDAATVNGRSHRHWRGTPCGDSPEADGGLTTGFPRIVVTFYFIFAFPKGSQTCRKTRQDNVYPHRWCGEVKATGRHWRRLPRASCAEAPGTRLEWAQRWRPPLVARTAGGAARGLQRRLRRSGGPHCLSSHLRSDQTTRRLLESWPEPQHARSARSAASSRSRNAAADGCIHRPTHRARPARSRDP